MLKRMAVAASAAVPVMAVGVSLHFQPVEAAGTWVVNTNADAVANEGDCTGSNTCTLRDAVTLSDAAGGTNTITFATSVTAPIALTFGPLEVTNQALTVTGNGTSTTIIDGAGNGTSGIFNIVNSQCQPPPAQPQSRTAQACAAAVHAGRHPGDVTVTGTLTLTGTTLRNGTNASGGGAVVVNPAADFNASDDLFSGNSATGGSGGAIFSPGTVDIAGSTFSQNTAVLSGGAVGAQGALQVSGSTFTGNTAVLGGAVGEGLNAVVTITTSTFTQNHATSGEIPGMGGAVEDSLDSGGSLSISQSTFSANVSDGDGGAVWAGVEGFPTTTSSISIDNSTFTGNTASNDGGAIVDAFDTASLVNDTVLANTASGNGGGGGVSAQSNSDVGAASITYSDDLLVSNNPANCDYPTDFPTPTVTADHSIDTGSSCQLGSSNGNVQNQAAPALRLDSQLRDNGGSTQTVALLPGSAAIDTGGNSTCAATDQRGVSRPQHATCDVGAFEVDETTTTLGTSQSAPGADVVLTATVAGTSSDAGVPQGTVTFTKNGASVGSAPADAHGVATLDLPFTTAADPLYAATYVPSNGFFGSSGSKSFTPAAAAVPVPDTGAGGAPAGAALAILGAVALAAGGRRRR